MAYLPPFARMRAIKKANPTLRAPVPVSEVAPEPTNVAEALAQMEPEAPPVEPEISEVEAAEGKELENSSEVEEEVAPEPVVEEEAAPVPAPEPVVEEEASEGPSEGPSMDMSRRELNAMAMDAGIDRPDKLGNKQDVIDAILEASK